MIQKVIVKVNVKFIISHSFLLLVFNLGLVMQGIKFLEAVIWCEQKIRASLGERIAIYCRSPSKNKLLHVGVSLDENGHMSV